ncbi:MAG TPA: mannose-1-phosphate guanylyltransferase/mannose-6-phosphate isomerase [Cellvibrionaceae bacterium]
MSVVVPVVLSGGSGSRLWPKSRQFYPKQLHKLYGDCTMLQHTLKRVDHLGEPIIICNNEQRFMVADQVQAIGLSAQIILEPIARNTAPAITVAALSALNTSSDAIIVVLAADHLIENTEEFRRCLAIAIDAAKHKKLVTFGVVPTRPETGYGYLKTATTDLQVNAVEQFVEKPNRELAEEYLAAGCYYWNSGMFVFPAAVLINELNDLQPGMVNFARTALVNAEKDLDFVRLSAANFEKCPNISIDYALMEHTSNAWSVPLNAGWSDLGSWDAVWDVAQKDSSGNSFEGDVILQDCDDCFVMADTRLVTLLGVKNLAVIETADGVLVVDKNRAQDVKNIVAVLQSQNRQEHSLHREVHRPWGSYDSIDRGERYQVKHINVKPGASMSLQMHHHRAEHWVVVAGTALIQKAEKELFLTENQSIFIPIGEKHRIHNPGKVPLHLIEVQTGSYLGEDDIVRFEDGYGRL